MSICREDYKCLYVYSFGEFLVFLYSCTLILCDVYALKAGVAYLMSCVICLVHMMKEKQRKEEKSTTRKKKLTSEFSKVVEELGKIRITDVEFDEFAKLYFMICCPYP